MNEWLVERLTQTGKPCCWLVRSKQPMKERNVSDRTSNGRQSKKSEKNNSLHDEISTETHLSAPQLAFPTKKNRKEIK